MLQAEKVDWVQESTMQKNKQKWFLSLRPTEGKDQMAVVNNYKNKSVKSLAAKKGTTSTTAKCAAQKTLTISLEIVKAPKRLFTMEPQPKLLL